MEIMGIITGIGSKVASLSNCILPLRGNFALGINGRCFAPDGTNQQIAPINLSSNFHSTGKCSISFWVKPSNILAYGYYIMAQFDGDNYMNLGHRNNGQAFTQIEIANVKVNTTFGTLTFQQDVWQNIIFTFDGTTHLADLGGVSETALGRSDISTLAVTLPFVPQNDTNLPFQIFDVRLYKDKVLTANEREFVRTFGTSGTDPGTPLGWWKMNEQSGTTATDSSGNGNDGTIQHGNDAYFETQNIHDFG